MSRAPSPPEFKREPIELARASHSFTSLSREFGPHGQTIQAWVKQADPDEVGTEEISFSTLKSRYR